MPDILKYVQQSLTESQQNQVFTNWGLGDVARLNYENTSDYAAIIVVYPVGAVCTITNGITTYTAPDTSGSWICEVDSIGEWTVTAVGAYTVTQNVTLTLNVSVKTVTLRFATTEANFTFKYNNTTYTFTPSTTTSSVSGVYYFYKSGTNWEFYALKSGTIATTNNVDMKVDVYLQGGGYNGGHGKGSYNVTWGGSQIYYYEGTGASSGTGGIGGYRKLVANQTLRGSYSVTVGAAASHSSFGSLTSSGGTSVSAGSNGTYAFGDSSSKGPDGNSRRVGAGGGNGGWTFYPNGGSASAGSGGNYGAGNGGSASVGTANAGANATFYGSGGGGGGAWARSERRSSYSGNDPDVIASRCGDAAGGSGYQGFVAMRNSRSA